MLTPLAQVSTNTMLLGNLDGADLGVLLAYFIIVFAVGIWVTPHLTSQVLALSPLVAIEAVSVATSSQVAQCIGYR